MSMISHRLKQILSDRGLTATELSRMSDVRVSFIYDVLSGKSQNPSIITLSKIANSLAIPLNELSGNEKPAIGSGHSSKLSQSYAAIAKLDVEVSAGGGSQLDNSEHANIEHYMFRRNWIRSGLNTQPEHLRMLSITGDSMEPTITHGDSILVDTSKTNPSPPGIFVLHDGCGLVVKRIEIIPGSQQPRLRILSDNTQYPPYERDMHDTRIIGRVVWFARQL